VLKGIIREANYQKHYSAQFEWSIREKCSFGVEEIDVTLDSFVLKQAFWPANM